MGLQDASTFASNERSLRAASHPEGSSGRGPPREPTTLHRGASGRRVDATEAYGELTRKAANRGSADTVRARRLRDEVDRIAREDFAEGDARATAKVDGKLRKLVREVDSMAIHELGRRAKNLGSP